MLYRVKQFTSAVFAKVNEDDKQFYKQYLTPSEVMLFEKLQPADQKHALRVARLLEAMTSKDAEMIRAGLLHDIGKQFYPLSPIEKGMMVILNKLMADRVKKWTGLKMVKGYYQHPQLGYELLKGTKQYGDDFLMLVRDHHNKEVTGEKLKCLQEADDRA